MKILINEKQLKLILSKEHEIEEQDATTAPVAGTDPDVGKWDSGVSRGSANQIGVTKWSDVVGSSLKRDKANKLK